jgi:hypothetical protein
VSRPAFRCEVYDKAFQRIGFVGAPISATIIPKRWAPGTATVVVPADHQMVGPLLEPGARMWLKDFETRQHLMSGWVTGFRISGPERRARVEFDLMDDFVILQRILGWVVPDAPITGQGTAGTNWTMNGPAEDVLIAALQENAVERLGLPLALPTPEGRGAAVKARLRFNTLYDRLVPVEDGAGLIDSGIEVGVQQNPDAPGLLLTVREPRTITKILNERSGVVREWSVNGRNATVTRAVAGGQGEGQLRLFREKADEALEAAFGWKFEAFRDARDSDDPDVMYERIDETLKEGAAVSGMSVELSETANFIARPDKLWTGDILTMRLAGHTVTDKLAEVTLSSTRSGGFTTRPRIGEYTDNPDAKLAKIVRGIGRRLRLQNSDT